MELDRKRLRELSWSAIGATAAISVALLFAADEGSPFLLASLGGSTIFLFALTETEAAQPQALFGGHLGGAIIGILAFQLFGDALWVSAPGPCTLRPAPTRYSWFTIMPVSAFC